MGNGSKKSRALTRDQFFYILDEFRDKGDVRMELICLLLGRCIRVGCVLRVFNIDTFYTPEWTVRDAFGWNEEKTGKWRLEQVGAISRLRECLEKYSYKLRELPRDARLFYGQHTGLTLRDKGVKKLLAGMVGRRAIEQCSPHSFRKYGGRYLHFQCGVDIETISQLMNHASVRETRTYLDIRPQELARAAAQLVV